jgi:hypothetical protein
MTASLATLAFVLLAVAGPEEALRAGNRLFEAGDLEAALEAYAAGWGAASTPSDPLLAYNLGATAHHLGRIPEAVLWYRRAEAAALDDPWLRENLAIARRSLGMPPEGPRSPWGLWARGGRWLALAGVILAWAALALLLARRRAAPVALLAGVTFAAGLLLALRGPRAAVLLEDCSAREELPQDLPAGSEVWVTPDGNGGWRVLGGPRGLRCPGPAVGLVVPRKPPGADMLFVGPQLLLSSLVDGHHNPVPGVESHGNTHPQGRAVPLSAAR